MRHKIRCRAGDGSPRKASAKRSASTKSPFPPLHPCLSRSWVTTSQFPSCQCPADPRTENAADNNAKSSSATWTLYSTRRTAHTCSIGITNLSSGPGGSSAWASTKLPSKCPVTTGRLAASAFRKAEKPRPPRARILGRSELRRCSQRAKLDSRAPSEDSAPALTWSGGDGRARPNKARGKPLCASALRCSQAAMRRSQPTSRSMRQAAGKSPLANCGMAEASTRSSRERPPPTAST
mmetsp:Transcript_39158/g.101508  ORF Transcript_39158/g.101508 Transcript_39158/m.101508 type:complete len:237 (-) Transcript_39158:808-1518(-)